MAEIAILSILAIIGTAIALGILWRVIIFALKVAFVLVFALLVIKAVIETMWGAILIIYGSILWIAGHTINLYERIRRNRLAARRRKLLFA
jgi:hypothetical protein